MATLRAPPRPDRSWALFLDIDGTLLDIAPSPGAVVVPADLPETLLAASQFLSGALAFISGRTLQDVDRLMAPLRLPCAAEHGALLRFPDGSIRSHGLDHAVPAFLRDRMRAEIRKWPGAILEEKRFNVVFHFRQSPEFGTAIGTFAEAIAREAGPAFEVLPARMAFEIRHRDVNKGAALHAFMDKAPFATRVPVFIGDDVTDDDGFVAARELGGRALEMRDMFGDPAPLRCWLRSFA